MKLAITFTNPQIVRNYLFDPDHNLLKNLVFNEVTLVCNNQTFTSVVRIIDTYPIEIKSKVKVQKNSFDFANSLALQVLNLTAKSHVHSRFSIAKFFRSKSKKEISSFGLILRLLLFIITFRNVISAKILRKLTLIFLEKTESFKRLSEFKYYNLFVALSLTDDLDSLMIAFAKQNGIKSIGTVRSWDNLTSHGLIRVKPDIFYSHSQAMSKDLSNFHYYACNSHNTVLGKSFWVNFEKVKEIKSKTIFSNQVNEYKILYGAMGDYFNPSEKLLLEKIIALVLQDYNINFTILMHPKFPLSSDFQNNGTQSYTNYLEYLSNYDLILSSGSTLLLDANLINKNISHINFEMYKVPYWESIKRYLDFRKYYKSFLVLSETPIINSIEELASNLNSKGFTVKDKFTQQNTATEFFLGNPNNLSLSDLINSY
jgi:hypothetical protein